jgi:hypothetical protein
MLKTGAAKNVPLSNFTNLQHKLFQGYACHLRHRVLPHADLKALPRVAAEAGARTHTAGAAVALHCCCLADPILNKQRHPAGKNRGKDSCSVVVTSGVAVQNSRCVYRQLLKQLLKECSANVPMEGFAT